MPQTRNEKYQKKDQEPRDPERLLGRRGLKSWLNPTLTQPSARPLPEHGHPGKLPGTRAQVRSPRSRCPALTLRPASGAMCVQTVAAASRTPRCWSATGVCIQVSGPSPALSVACASRGSSPWRHTNGSIAPALGGGEAGGLGSGLCLVPRSGVTGTHPCCSGTTPTSLRSVGERLPQVGLSLTLALRTDWALREAP